MHSTATLAAMVPEGGTPGARNSLPFSRLPGGPQSSPQHCPPPPNRQTLGPIPTDPREIKPESASPVDATGSHSDGELGRRPSNEEHQSNHRKSSHTVDTHPGPAILSLTARSAEEKAQGGSPLPYPPPFPQALGGRPPVGPHNQGQPATARHRQLGPAPIASVLGDEMPRCRQCAQLRYPFPDRECHEK